MRKTFVIAVLVAASMTVLGVTHAKQAWADSERSQVTQILEATGVKGGLIVHVGCGDGSLTAALLASDSYLVHGLDTDAANVAKARQHIQSLGQYGKVSVDRLTGKRLPYIENSVNLLVAEELGAVPMTEVMRVLCPHGVAYIQQGGKWTKSVKPRPEAMDEWTHALHDSSNNAVAHDDLIDPPRRLQWSGSPRWSRHHDHMSSVSAVVSSGNRVFYIFDEGPRSSIFLPSQWVLIARDAFNGCILWKRSIPNWHVRLWPLKSGPAQLARRLVAVDQTVYATLDLAAPLTALDAATGETIRTYEGTDSTEEIVFSDGVLFLVVRPEGVESTLHGKEYESLAAVKGHRAQWGWQGGSQVIVAVNAKTGVTLWRKPVPVAQATLAVDGRSTYCYDGENIVCLDRTNGKPRWQSPVASRALNHSGYTPNLVIHDDVVLFAGGDKAMTALSAQTGEKLWSAEHHRGGHNSPQDLLVVGGLAWSAAIAGSNDSGIWTGRDLKTGEIKNEFLPDVETYWFHHRCYRAKATDRYLLPSRTGIEFVDFNKQTWQINHWVRGACLYGIMPCNGLIYAPQHPCACYPEAKLNGFTALTAGSRVESPAPREKERLERGPAFGQTLDPDPSTLDSSWPTYRGNAARTGSVTSALSTKLDEAWRTELGGKLSAVTVAGDRLFVASVETHTVHALDATSGKQLWSYTVGGCVDSPPTIHDGLALFGSADGYVYCLRASDGELAWRFLAAPMDERLMVFEQLESVWPVHGSVLVQDGVLYFAAGRNMFLDGGVWAYRLDPKTGKVLSMTHLDDRDPKKGENLQVNVQVLNMPVAAPDILSSDGKRVYMKSQVFDLEGNRQELGPHSGEPAKQGAVQGGETAHLFCPSGFLDDSWWHRTYWVFGRSFAGGHAGYSQAGKYAPSGRILVSDDSTVYGFGRKPQYYRWTTPLEHQLFAAEKPPLTPPKPAQTAASRRGRTAGTGIRVENSPSLNPTGKPLTVEAWANSEAKDGVVLARGGPSFGYALLFVGGKPQFTVRTAAKADASSVSAKQPAMGKWIHLAGVLTSEKLQLYVDGQLAASGETKALIGSDPKQTLEIGGDDGGAVGNYKSPFAFKGLIDEVKVYHRALTADEIESHAAQSAKKPTGKDGLVLHLSFDQGKANDTSGQDNNGTILTATPADGKLGKGMKFTRASSGSSSRRGAQFFVKHHWTQDLPLLVRAMLLADKTLFIAGPPDVMDEDEAARRFGDPDIQAAVAEQHAALNGKRGVLLRAVSAADGSKLAEYKLDFMPIFDGLAAANGCLYFSTTDGKIVCLAGK